jgi:multiple sugar transport system permease protein
MAASAPAAPAASAAQSSKKPVYSDRTKAERRLGMMLCAPAAFVMIAVTIYPIVNAFVLSLQRSDLRFPDENEFVGLSNYVTVLTAGRWWADVFHTVVLTVISVGLELVLGMLLALVMHRAIFGRGLVRTASLVPYGIVTVVAAFAWRLAFSGSEGGFVPAALNSTTDPLTETWSLYLVAILAETWKTTPFMALLLLAGLSQVSDELHEAARVDGASAWQRFWKITVPLIKPAILVAILFRTLDAFRIFDTIYVLTASTQNRSIETVSNLGYNQLLTQLNLGVGSTISVLIFAMVALIAFMFVKLLGTDVQQGN